MANTPTTAQNVRYLGQTNPPGSAIDGSLEWVCVDIAAPDPSNPLPFPEGYANVPDQPPLQPLLKTPDVAEDPTTPAAAFMVRGDNDLTSGTTFINSDLYEIKTIAVGALAITGGLSFETK